MNSPMMTLSMQFWQRGLFAFSSVALFVVFYAGTASYAMQEFATRQTSYDLSLLVFLMLAPAMAATVAIANDGIEQRFVLPVSSTRLSVATISNTAAMASALYLVLVAFVQLVLSERWPIFKPLAFLLAIVLVSHACAYLFDFSTKTRAMTAALCAMMLGAGVIIYQIRFHNAESVTINFWVDNNSFEMMFALLVAAGSVWLTNMCLARSRRGELLPGTLLVREIQGSAGTELSKFASAGAAANWYEWRGRGVALPGIALCCLLSYLTIGFVQPEEWMDKTINGSVAISGVIAWSIFFYGIYVVHRGEYGDFDAAMPVSDGDYATRKLLVAGRSLIWTWGIWWVGHLALYLLFFGAEFTTMGVEDFRRVRAIPQNTDSVVVMWLLVVALTFFISCLTMGWGMLLGLIGNTQRNLILLAIGLWLFARIFFSHSHPEIDAFATSLVTHAVTAVSLLMIGLGLSSKHVPNVLPHVAIVVSVFLALFGYSTQALTDLSTLYVIELAIITSAPLAGAPLLIRRWRHQ